MAKDNKLRCSICEQTFKEWWTDRRGNAHSGWFTLRRHMIMDHPADAAEMGFIVDKATKVEPPEDLWDPEEDNEEANGNRQGWELMQFWSD